MSSDSVALFPNERRGRTTLWLLISMLVPELFVSIPVYYFQIRYGNGYSRMLADENWRIGVAFAAMFLLILHVFTIIYFLRWFKRAYHNVAQLTGKMRYSARMSVGAWFIPVFHWIGPIRMMFEMLRKTEAVLIKNGVMAKKVRVYYVLVLWWFFYVCAGLIDIFDHTQLHPDMRFKSIRSFSNYALVFRIVNDLLTVFAIVMVQNYRKRERMLRKLLFVREVRSQQNPDILDEQFTAL